MIAFKFPQLPPATVERFALKIDDPILYRTYLIVESLSNSLVTFYCLFYTSCSSIRKFRGILI
ncbi:unnamed protein product [Periconia digitata]|uniref:Uncharacterized protein n=1 Tax=Periconia digitata TaxID=1303443 RepID=A0A9W4UB82_9PLEO|nr:unnamed protein product [Periconia digitata]